MAGTTKALTGNGAGVPAKSKIREYTESILWSILLFLILRTCVVQSFIIPSGSMENTLLVGDCLLVNKFIYGIKVPFTDVRIRGLRDPGRGDVVVFRYPLDRSKDFIKRVVGVPGDEILIRDKVVYVNGSRYDTPHDLHKDFLIVPGNVSPRDNFGPIRVPPHSYFMMGDNRDNSNDSRFWGVIDSKDVVGEAMIKFWAWDDHSWRPVLGRIGTLID